MDQKLIATDMKNVTCNGYKQPHANNTTTQLSSPASFAYLTLSMASFIAIQPKKISRACIYTCMHVIKCFTVITSIDNPSGMIFRMTKHCNINSKKIQSSVLLYYVTNPQ